MKSRTLKVLALQLSLAVGLAQALPAQAGVVQAYISPGVSGIIAALLSWLR